MQYSHSRVELFENCPYRYQLKYREKLEVLPSDDPTNALFLGTALHEGIEKGVKHGIQKYYDAYPIITNAHVNESMKLEYWIPKVQDVVQELCGDATPIFEHKIDHPDLVGFMDLMIPTRTDGIIKYFKLYDFKYSNHQDRYLKSRQLHEYKHFYEKLNPTHKIEETGFIFIPKTQIRQKKTEDLVQFRKRLMETLNTLEISVVKVDYRAEQVIEFYSKVKEISEATEFPKNECGLCNFCEYKEFCKEGATYMIIPQFKRNQHDVANRKKKVWLYGAPFSGKTTLADKFPSPAFMNTDGNIYSYSGTTIPIKETFEGRIKVGAWENFKNAIDAFQKESYGHETLVVDLVEDCYEHCRVYCYDKLGIEHESDNNFKAWDFVRKEFLDTIRKLLNLDYNIVLISHEDTTEDITKKQGDKITKIKPNIKEKVANKLSGMVDVVCRVVADNGTRTLQFVSDEVVFGGGRLGVEGRIVDLSYEALEEVYREAAAKMNVVEPQAQPKVKQEEPVKSWDAEAEAKKIRDEMEEDEEMNGATSVEPNSGEANPPVRRTRRRRVTEE